MKKRANPVNRHRHSDWAAIRRCSGDDKVNVDAAAALQSVRAACAACRVDSDIISSRAVGAVIATPIVQLEAALVKVQDEGVNTAVPPFAPNGAPLLAPMVTVRG